MANLKWALLLGLWLLLAGGASGFGPPSLVTGEPFGQTYTSTDLAAMQAAPVVPTTASIGRRDRHRRRHWHDDR